MSLIGSVTRDLAVLLAARFVKQMMAPRRSSGGQADRGLVGGEGGAMFDSWLISGLIDRKLWIGWFGTCVCRELVPAPTALAAPALWCSFLQVHAATGPPAGASCALRLVFRQLLGCLESEEGEELMSLSPHVVFKPRNQYTTNMLHWIQSQ